MKSIIFLIFNIQEKIESQKTEINVLDFKLIDFDVLGFEMVLGCSAVMKIVATFYANTQPFSPTGHFG